ncbi:putative arginine--tRNA ligase [Helianthus annuus]|nr:putative arginine--tRNA ligase [Helianthus annuus]
MNKYPKTSHVGFGLVLGDDGKRFRTCITEVAKLVNCLIKLKLVVKRLLWSEVKWLSGLLWSLNKLLKLLNMVLLSAQPSYKHSSSMHCSHISCRLLILHVAKSLGWVIRVTD